MKNSSVWLILSAFLLFFLQGILVLDPDFGWHIQTGNFILHYGIPTTDPFSYTMPSYVWVYHEWLYEVLLARIFPTVSFVGISLLMAIALTIAVWLQVKKYPRIFAAIPFILGVTAILPLSGIRPQVLGWFFFSLILCTILSKKTWTTYCYFLPLLMLLWANIHASFVAGIILLLLYGMVTVFQTRSISYPTLVTIGLSSLATLLNPFGSKLWLEAVTISSSLTAQHTISEWSSGLFYPNICVWILAVLAGIVILRYKKQFVIEGILYISFFGASISAMKYIPFFVLITIGITTKGFGFFYHEASGIKNGAKRLRAIFPACLLGVALVTIAQVLFSFYQTTQLTEQNFYPTQALAYLKNNLPEKHLFTTYAWGGYVVWKLPEKKVFIDGRMPTWKQYPPPPKESAYAFGEYLSLYDGTVSLGTIATKYNIDTLLLPVEKPAKDTLEQQAKELKWREVYRDDIGIIYKISDDNSD